MGIASTTPISLKYRVGDTFAVSIFEPWRNLPVLENKSPILNNSLTKQMFFEKRLFVNNDIFGISVDLVDDILIRNDIWIETLFIESWNISWEFTSVEVTKENEFLYNVGKKFI